MNDPPQGWVWCAGVGQPAVFVSRYPGKIKRWWKCPHCSWVGWSTNSDKEWLIPHHLTH